MPNTKSTFDSIDSSFLADVNGGCGRRRCRCGGKTVNIVNNYGAAPAAPAAAPAPSGTAVDVNVGYQQA